MNPRILFLPVLIVFVTVSIPLFAAEPTEVSEKLITNIANDEIVDNSLLINADSTRIVFLAKDGDKQYMIINNKRFKKYDYVRNPSFSADGKVLSCIVTDKGQDRPVVEGKAGGTYVDIQGSIVLSSDGKHNAFVARDGNKPTFIVVLDGEEQKFTITEPDTCTLVFNPDGTRLAYNISSYDEEAAANKYSIVVNGKEGAKYDVVSGATITFSPDGKSLAYVARMGDEWAVVRDGKESTKYDNVGAYTGLVFSPDGKRFAFAAKLDEKWFMVVDGKEEEQFDDVGRIVFNPDGNRYAYWGKEGDKVCLVENGVKGTKKADQITGIIFSPLSNHLAYCVKSKERWFVVLDDKKQKTYDNIALPLPFNPEGTKLAYGAQEGSEWVFVIDGKEGKKHEAVLNNMFAFSPEGTHLVYGVLNDDVPSLVINGIECEPRYERVYNVNGGGLKFECDNVFHYIATKGNDIFLVTETIK